MSEESLGWSSLSYILTIFFPQSFIKKGLKMPIATTQHTQHTAQSLFLSTISLLTRENWYVQEDNEIRELLSTCHQVSP